MTPGVVIAAPSSGSGKTILTLGLLRAFRDAGLVAGSAKIGPDYIDPRFHEAASGRPSVNLDGWAMRRDRILALAAQAGQGADILVVEGVMGLFDRPAEPGIEGDGGAASVAKTLGAPVVMVLDASGMAQSAGALAAGFRDFDRDVEFAGVILNRVASPRHEALSREGCAAAGVTVFGAVPRRAQLATPSRHLGLVQAEEVEGLEARIREAAELIAASVDLDALRAAARPFAKPSGAPAPFRPLGAGIAIASDVAFRFAYPHLLEGWRDAGAGISFFSPLADQAPDRSADAVFLPGGYPELHAGRIAAAADFRAGLRAAAKRGAAIYGECGGYMVLGEGLIDGEGRAHEMLGLLPLETSFATRRLHLGYRDARLVAAGPLGPAGDRLLAHEFHYATTVREGAAEPLFRLASGGTSGLRRGRVTGSFLHVIDRG
ncbi:cobyrinate a,c-diamide synthase [Hansschlegelia zhihuaiae]|uniref:Hydrogenobyrinate a,c-diamide synthase n=1 Tax=Hansschlegelia zhihuaiae TaxID=405005 RepID=A0A4Q0MJW3_9HYPH|nr:cobyrinate a,c-diamide synthase [Hansschlegelia zhihuaiae]RXF73848.1 cobyrinate a,c-diamide synthase [Hansschlegelia zhihuaiae]